MMVGKRRIAYEQTSLIVDPTCDERASHVDLL